MNSETSRMGICYRSGTSANTYHIITEKSITSTVSAPAYRYSKTNFPTLMLI